MKCNYIYMAYAEAYVSAYVYVQVHGIYPYIYTYLNHLVWVAHVLIAVWDAQRLMWGAGSSAEAASRSKLAGELCRNICLPSLCKMFVHKILLRSIRANVTTRHFL